MKTTIKTARLALIGSAVLLMLSGMVLWNGGGDRLGPFHALLGLVLAASLWTIAAVAARAGVPLGIVALAVAWSLAAVALGATQEALLPGSAHWVVQVLHLVTAMGMVAWGQGLVLLTHRAGARRERSVARAPKAETAH